MPDTTPSSDDTAVPAEWLDKVAGTLISPVTLLATDYLNHFNEVIMLIDMIPDMPDMLPDVQGWKPKSYPQHFRDSGLTYRELAAEAYEHVPPAFKRPFDQTIIQLNSAVSLAVKRLSATVPTGDAEQLRRTARSAVDTLKALLGVADAIIGGGRTVLHQEEIDRLLAG